jgi:hypothetical protein
MTPELKERLYRELMQILMSLEEGDFNGATMELEDLINRLKINKLGENDEISNFFFLVFQLWKAKIEDKNQNQSFFRKNMSELKVDQSKILRISRRIF